MSLQHECKPYDRIFDSQKHFRTLLQCSARPGLIGQLDNAEMEIPAQLNRATAWLLLALLGRDCSFHFDRGSEHATRFIERETDSQQADAGNADFLIFPDDNCLEGLHKAQPGTLSFPDSGATAILQVEALSPAPLPGSLRLELSGPGIEHRSEIYVLGASKEFFATLRQLNAEYPMGVDAYLTCDSLSAGPCVLALPRTTNVRWEHI